MRKIIKNLGFVWKRVRKSLKKRRDQKLFESAKKDIDKFLKQHKKGEISLHYFDGSHFSLTPTVPYAWQEPGNEIEILSQKGGQNNVLGLLTPDCKFKSLIYESKVDTETIIEAFNIFFKYKRKDEKYVIVLDNAPTHKSDEFIEAMKKWEVQGIEFYFLPPYSPELNKIEILWRFIKYTWLPLEAYVDKNSLQEHLVEVLRNVGTKYRITLC